MKCTDANNEPSWQPGSSISCSYLPRLNPSGTETAQMLLSLTPLCFVSFFSFYYLLSYCDSVLAVLAFNRSTFEGYWSSHLTYFHNADLLLLNTLPSNVITLQHRIRLERQRWNCSVEPIWHLVGLSAVIRPLLFQAVFTVISPGNSVHLVLTPNHVTWTQSALVFMVKSNVN